MAYYKEYHFYVANQEYMKNKTKQNKSNQETNKQNKNTHADKQLRFS